MFPSDLCGNEEIVRVEFAFGWIGCCCRVGRESAESRQQSDRRLSLSALSPLAHLLYIEMVGCKLFFEAERGRECIRAQQTLLDWSERGIR